MKRITLLSAALLAFSALAASAQQPSAPPPELVDGVAAVVGDSVVLISDIDDQIRRLRASGRRVPTGGRQLEALREQLLSALVNELLIVQAAARDSMIVVDEDQLRSRVEEELDRRRTAMGGQRAFEAALQRDGLSLQQYQSLLAQELRTTDITQQFMGRIQAERPAPPVTDSEIREFFEERKEQIGERPATITFRQIVVPPRPSDEARAAARAKAEDIRRQLVEEDADFAVMARRHSEDPGSRERGGDLGWFGPTDMVAGFERMAYALRPGQISPVVETSFGFHIIKLERIRGKERKAAHILIKPETSPDDADRAREEAEEVARLVREGGDMQELVREHGDTSEQLRVGPIRKEGLPAPYDETLANAEAGAVVGPFRLPSPAGDKWVVARVIEATEAGLYTPEDDQIRSQIRRTLEQNKLVEEIVDELRQRTYVDIRI